DEERSETRKVMRIAESVSHRIFERTLRLLVFQEARLSERHYVIQAQLDVGRSVLQKTPRPERVGVLSWIPECMEI
ncbi:hypothetical protein DD570_31035, partial [Klebsiella pneumoniae]